jgi:hypothetical protein
MKGDRFLKPLLLVFVGALVFYAAAYFGIEHVRHRKGPWSVTFTHTSSGEPAIVIDQPALQISNVMIRFAEETRTNQVAHPTAVVFDPPRAVPHDVPFGQCIFIDTTFLPGTVVLELFGHQIQLIPRVLTLDGEEKRWVSGAVHSLQQVKTNAGRSL